MKDIIDLNGASGTTYRFRLWPPGGAHLPMAGNYAFVREAAGAFELLAASAIEDLSLLNATRAATAVSLGATHLFTRLNVSRAIRTAEANDIAAFYNLDMDTVQRS